MQLVDGYNYAKRQLSDGRWLYVSPLTYGRARLNISSTFNPLIFDNGYWFETPELAVSEFHRWNPEEEEEPHGWFRNPQTGRRRPNGNPDEEYIAY